MYSIQFPEMFSSAKTNLIQDKDATLSNLKLLLQSWKFSLFGDPYYGTNLKKLLFDQNNQVLRDLVIDDIYTQVKIFMPQVVLDRRDISIEQDGIDLYCNIKCYNLIDYTTDMYTILLTNDEDIYE